MSVLTNWFKPALWEYLPACPPIQNSLSAAMAHITSAFLVSRHYMALPAGPGCSSSASVSGLIPAWSACLHVCFFRAINSLQGSGSACH